MRPLNSGRLFQKTVARWRFSGRIVFIHLNSRPLKNQHSNFCGMQIRKYTLLILALVLSSLVFAQKSETNYCGYTGDSEWLEF